MKKYTAFLLLLSAVFALSGCENNFDPKIYGKLYPENYPSTQSEYETYALACYIPFASTWTYYIGEGLRQHNIYNMEGGVFRMFDGTSDVCAPWSTHGADEWRRLTYADYSNCFYYTRSTAGATNLNNIPKLAQITRFTEILGRVQSADPAIFTGGKKEQLIGDVSLCRAMMMYYLLHLYGPMPLILDPVLVNNDEAEKNIVRPTLAEMCEWITEDMERAIVNLPESHSERGRYTADYARFCLMKHCLNEGGHMDGYYARAMELYDELNTGKYGLFTTGTNPYVDLYKVENDFCKEIIMAQSNDPTGDGTDVSGNFFPFTMFTIPNDASAKDNNGNPTFVWTGINGWSQFFNVSPNFYATYDPADKRRDVVITEYWVKSGSDANPTVRRTSADLGVRWDGYIIYKYPIETDTPYQGNDFPVARWADVLLMFAELDVRISGAAPSTAAVSAVNQVRSRAGLGGLSAAQTASKDAFLDAILDERGKEFLYEGMRKIDLIRLNKYAQACKNMKGVIPTHQYMPLPNFIVEQAESYGKTLKQTYSRPEWEEDLRLANR